MEKQQLQQTQRLEELKLLMAQQEKQLNMSQVQIDKQRERETYISMLVLFFFSPVCVIFPVIGALSDA
jgi:hypothetical protein